MPSFKLLVALVRPDSPGRQECLFRRFQNHGHLTQAHTKSGLTFVYDCDSACVAVLACYLRSNPQERSWAAESPSLHFEHTLVHQRSYSPPPFAWVPSNPYCLKVPVTCTTPPASLFLVSRSFPLILPPHSRPRPPPPPLFSPTRSSSISRRAGFLAHSRPRLRHSCSRWLLFWISLSFSPLSLVCNILPVRIDFGTTRGISFIPRRFLYCPCHCLQSTLIISVPLLPYPHAATLQGPLRPSSLSLHCWLRQRRGGLHLDPIAPFHPQLEHRPVARVSFRSVGSWQLQLCTSACLGHEQCTSAPFLLPHRLPPIVVPRLLLQPLFCPVLGLGLSLFTFITAPPSLGPAQISPTCSLVPSYHHLDDEHELH